MQGHEDIRLGTIVPGSDKTAEYIRQILPHGFESFEITFGGDAMPYDLKKVAAETKKVLAGHDAIISAVGIYGNPLVDDEKGRATLASWGKLIDQCELFDCRLVCGFTGCIPNQPLPDSLPPFKKVFGPLVKRAEDKGVRIAFENCEMGGTWGSPRYNIAHAPTAWEMIFEAIPSDSLGLEWEPCHQMNSLIDPLPQLRKWVKKVFHLHGKDATVMWDVVRTCGIRGGQPFVYHRTPGFGDTNWADIISILRIGGFKGAIDIEGWHDPVYRKELETTGQVFGLNYLKRCRGGDFVPNPKV